MGPRENASSAPRQSENPTQSRRYLHSGQTSYSFDVSLGLIRCPCVKPSVMDRILELYGISVLWRAQSYAVFGVLCKPLSSQRAILIDSIEERDRVSIVKQAIPIVIGHEDSVSADDADSIHGFVRMPANKVGLEQRCCSYRATRTLTCPSGGHVEFRADVPYPEPSYSVHHRLTLSNRDSRND